MAKRPVRINSDLPTIGAILAGEDFYRIPVYQRDYSWKVEEVKQLWEDINEAIDGEQNEYFLGTIVVHEDDDTKVRYLIDGQQRMVTVTIILATIRHFFAELNDERQYYIHNTYLGTKDLRTLAVDSKLRLNEINDQFFQDTVVNDVSDSEVQKMIKEMKKKDPNLRLLEALSYIREQIRKRVEGQASPENYLLRLVEFIKDNLMVILLTVGDEADAYLIFETVNNRGLDPSTSDLLKNYIFRQANKLKYKKVETKLNEVRNYWNQMNLILGSQDVRQFIRYYWLSNYGIVSEKDLFREVKKQFAKPGPVVEFMKKLYGASRIYSALINPDSEEWMTYNSEFRKNLQLLNSFGFSQFRCLLLAAYDCLDKNEIQRLTKIIIAISIRYSIIGGLNSSVLEKTYSTAAMAVRSGKAKSVKAIFLLLEEVYPDDEKFKLDFSQASIKSQKVARYILACLSNTMDSNEINYELEDETKFTLEHIMPQRQSIKWKSAAKDLTEYLSHVHRLGNLTLLERNLNKIAGNAGFDEKTTKSYAMSNVPLTQELTSYSDWRIKDITRRQKKLAEVAAEIWKVSY